MNRQKPLFYDQDRRALSDAVRHGRSPDVVRALTRRAVAAQMKLLGPSTREPGRK